MWRKHIFPSTRWRGFFTAIPLATAAVLAGWTSELWREIRSPFPIFPTPRYDASQRSSDDGLEFGRVAVPRPLDLRRGHTLGGLLAELGLEPREVHAAVEALTDRLDVRRVRPGELGLAYFSPGGRLASLEMRWGGEGRLELERREGGWSSSWHEFEREARVRRIEGELEDFLESAVREAGGLPQVAYAMSDVLQWDLDFNRDPRIGDRFRVLYEEVYLDGEPAGLGEILALDYTNRGRRYEAYRYGEEGYYDAEGRPLRKMFLRSPLPFSRVTSRFSHRRFHPVLKVHRPHYGVDYGAPRGTPVRVTASGTVTFAGTSGGAGRMVKVRHTNGYLTAYLHLSGYAKGIRRGRRVAQGDVIGYVGSTGLATAPHLDYRVQKNGRWMDPLSLKSEPVEPIPRHELASFQARCEALRTALAADSRLDASRRPTRVARHTATREDRPAKTVAR